MCGIFGVINNDSHLISDKIMQVMASRMIHRGPDDEGIKNGNYWAVGMRRLSIIDLEGGHQPISTLDETVHLVANGEIYNYQELRADLINLGYRFKTESDVEVIIHLYEEYGYDAIHHLNGMFAFALFDEKKNTLWIARDRLGIKPLYYGWSNDGFGFSSELTGLATILESSLCPKAAVDFLGYSYVPAPDTLFQGIKKLMPGEEMMLVNGKATFNQYWKCDISERYTGGVGNAIEQLDELLKDSIKLQLISDVPLGVFLSGGVDSSAIASYAAEHRNGTPIDTFTIDFEGKKGKDAQFASEVSSRLGTNHHVIKVDAQDQFDALEELISLMDEPMSDSAIVPTYMLSKAAREKGMKVLLSGAGGDEIFGGYPRHFPSKKFSAAWFAGLPRPAKVISTYALGFINPAHKIRLQEPSRNFATNISGVNYAFLSEVLRSDDDFSRLLSKIDCDFIDAQSKNPYSLMAMDLNDYLPNNVLTLTDKATMAASVEGRVPLLDHRIVEFAFSLPQDINLLNEAQKGLFKQTLTSRLPSELLWREKEGFNAPIHYWVSQYPERIKDELLDRLSPFLANIINQDVIEKWLSHPKLRSQSGATLYALFVLNRWIRTHESK